MSIQNSNSNLNRLANGENPLFWSTRFHKHYDDTHKLS
eukprot:UN09349